MAGINKVTLIGNLGKDPETRYTQGGSAVCRLNVATSRQWMDKQTNQRVEETEWHRVTVWGKLAEHCDKYLSKGRTIYLEGRLKTSSYDDKNGEKRHSTEIIAENVQFLGGKQGDGDRREANDRRGQASHDERPRSSHEDDAYNRYAPAGPEDDDIPF